MVSAGVADKLLNWPSVIESAAASPESILPPDEFFVKTENVSVVWT